VGLEAVLDSVVEGAKAQQYLKRACRETDYLAHLVEQLLLLARQMLESYVFDLKQYLRWRCPGVPVRMQPSATQADLKLEMCAAPSC